MAKIWEKGVNDVGKVTKKIFNDGSSTALNQAEYIK